MNIIEQTKETKYWGMYGIDKNHPKPTRIEFRKNLMNISKYLKDRGDDYKDGVNCHTNYFVRFGVWGMFGSNCTNHLCYLVEEAMGFPFGKIEPQYPLNDVFMTTQTTSISDDGKSRECSTITTCYAIEQESA